MVANAPRRCDRSRTADRLMAQLTLTGTAAVEAGMHQDLFAKVVTAYYRTHGTITAGLRTAASELNELLTRRNLRERGSSQLLAILNIAVVRRDMLYLAQSGATQTLLITRDDFTRFFDPELTGRGLGIGRSFNLRFWQARIEPDDLLVFANQPPTAWSAELLSGSAKLTLDQFRRRLLSVAGPDLEAGVIQFRPGAGEIHHVEPWQAAAPVEQPPAPADADPGDAAAPLPEVTAPADEQPGSESTAPVIDQPQQAAAQPEERWPEPPSEAPDEAVYRPPEQAPAPAGRPAAQEPERTYRRARGIYIGDAASPRPARPTPPPSDGESRRKPARPPEPKRPPINLRKSLANIWRASKSARRKVDSGSRTMAGRLLPDQSASLSPSVMLFIAIAVPVLIVAIAATVYFYAPSGRSEQQLVFINQAIEFAEMAADQTEPALRRSNWQQVLYWLDQADAHGVTSESAALRRQANAALDAMDGILRLFLQPALSGGLPDDVRISHMVASPSEVFLLDAAEGRVLRLVRTAAGYEHDTRFVCGPGPSGEFMVSPLVDLILLPAESPYSILAVDDRGNLLYCAAGEESSAVQLPAPDPNWGEITAMTVEQGVLHLLDKPNNRIWLYVGQDYTYAEQPRLFFDNEVPQLSDVVDMVANNEDLYLLHQDGSMTTCIFRSFALAQTRCTNLSPYSDHRQGRSLSVERIADTQFIQMQTTAPPDPSLYILDAAGPSIYHFSLRLNLQNLLRPDAAMAPSGQRLAPGAFAISSNRIIYLAIGNQVYFAAMPN